MPFDTKTITTERLILRRFTMEDVPVLVELCNKPEICRGTLSLPSPYTEECARTWIESHEEGFRQGRCEFAITDRNTGVLYGSIGISCELKHGHGELGYMLDPAYWHHGYMTEAVRALIAEAFEAWGLNRVYALHFTTNPASGRVMQRCGMAYEGIQRQHVRKGEEYKDLLCYGILREEWNARNR